MEKKDLIKRVELEIHPLFWRLYARKFSYTSTLEQYELVKEITYYFWIFTLTISYYKFD
jgi:hypothetical protein